MGHATTARVPAETPGPAPRTWYVRFEVTLFGYWKGGADADH